MSDPFLVIMLPTINIKQNNNKSAFWSKDMTVISPILQLLPKE